MKGNQHKVSEKIDSFPSYQMSEATQLQIHQNVMDALSEPAASPKRNRVFASRFKVGIIAAAAITIISILTIDQLNNNPNTATEENSLPTEEPAEQIPTNAAEDIPFDPALLEQQATDILHTLNDRNMEALAAHVHPEKGLLFSPYLSISEETVHFEQNEIDTLLEDETTYLWGYGEANTEIRLSPADYFTQHLEAERFFEADEVFVDQENPAVEYSDYLQTVFPEAKIVEFYDAGTDQFSGLDWRSLNLVFEQDAENEWRLVAVINNLFTP